MQRKYFIGCIWLVLLPCVSIFVLLLILFPSCGEGSKEIAYARSIPDDRLEKLYEDVSRLANTGERLIRVPAESNAAPNELSDIEYMDIILDGIRARLMLKGCFDNFIVVQFKGIYRDEPEAIVLSWGEGNDYTEEQLWPK